MPIPQTAKFETRVLSQDEDVNTRKSLNFLITFADKSTQALSVSMVDEAGGSKFSYRLGSGDLIEIADSYSNRRGEALWVSNLVHAVNVENYGVDLDGQLTYSYMEFPGYVYWVHTEETKCYLETREARAQEEKANANSIFMLDCLYAIGFLGGAGLCVAGIIASNMLLAGVGATLAVASVAGYVYTHGFFGSSSPAADTDKFETQSTASNDMS